ncbi:TonB-dependent receptor [Sandaracinobacteroides hominis]|uniref:TonB-dependent receptor n=1 Tax=Sandaracinobacteroides hominis TaxID=2780086 RepID=UPI0018F7B96E|nr:TonB-dependent siderophore receptor [Sandaracinobacteroides hominis]
MQVTDKSATIPAFLAMGCIGFIASAQPALAQEAKQPETLGRVVVTDTEIEAESYRTEAAPSRAFTEPLLDTPRSVTIVNGDLMRRTGVTSLSEALRLVPGITLGAGEGGNPQGDRPFIRGFDAQGSTFIDGIRSVGGQSREIFAIEQVEVTKGSDSSFAGRGSAGGSINLISKRAHPGTDARVEGTLGNDSYKRLTADLNYQIGDMAAIRVNGMWHDQDVSGRDAMSYSRWGIAPTVSYGLGTPTEMSLGWYHLESDDLPDPGIPFERTQAQAVASGNKAIGPALNVNGQDVPRGVFYGLADRDFRITNVDEFHIRFSHEISDNVRAEFNAKYSNVAQSYIISQPDDSQGNVQKGLVWRRVNSRWADVDAFVLQQGFTGTFDTGSISHSFSAGGEWSAETSKRGSYVSKTGNVAINTSPRCTPEGIALYNCTSLFTPNPYDPWVNLINNVPTDIVQSPITGDNRAETWSLYAFDTISFTDKLLLNLGGRYDNYRQRAITRSAITGLATADLDYRDSFFSYQVGFVFKPTENGSIYISTGSSVTPPGSFVGEGSEGNAIGVSPVITLDDLKPETTKSYELGTKWDLVGGALSLTGAIFQTETKNARTTNANGLLEYVGQRRVRGFELSATGRPVEFWNLYAGYSYMDSEVVALGDNPTAAQIATLGKPFPNTPKNSFTAQTDFTFAERFNIGGGAIYNDKQYGSFGIGGVSRYAPSYWRFDLNGSAQITENIDLRVNVQNLFDKRYFDRTYTTHFVNQAPGRLATATLAVHF